MNEHVYGKQRVMDCYHGGIEMRRGNYIGFINSRNALQRKTGIAIFVCDAIHKSKSNTEDNEVCRRCQRLIKANQMQEANGGDDLPDFFPFASTF